MDNDTFLHVLSLTDVAYSLDEEAFLVALRADAEIILAQQDTAPTSYADQFKGLPGVTVKKY